MDTRRVKDCLATLSYYRSRISQYPEIRKAHESVVTDCRSKIQRCDRDKSSINLSLEFYKGALDIMYQSSVGEMEKVINSALAYIFHNRAFKIRLELEESKEKALYIVVVDEAETPPVTVDIKDGTGQGVRTVISFVLHVYYLLNKRAEPVLFLDEAYSMLSADYVERFFDFLRGLAVERGLSVVMISHDDRFMDYADKTYLVTDGRVEEWKK